MLETILIQRMVSAALCVATLVGLPACTSFQTPGSETSQAPSAQSQTPESDKSGQSQHQEEGNVIPEELEYIWEVPLFV